MEEFLNTSVEKWGLVEKVVNQDGEIRALGVEMTGLLKSLEERTVFQEES